MTSQNIGKGLGSLIPNKRANKTKSGVTYKPPVRSDRSATPIQTSDRIIKALTKEINVNPHQPRTKIDHVALDDLINSIREHGIIQPLLVTKVGEGYQLIAGERRLQSAKIIGLKQVPIIIRDANEQQRLELALVENIQRQDLNPIEKALGYKKLIDEFNLTQEGVAKKVGKSRVAVAQSLRLLALPQRVQKSLVEGRLTEGHGKVLLSLPDEKAVLKLWKKIIKQDLTIRGAEEAKTKVATVRKLKPISPELVNQEEDLQICLNTRVRINSRGRRGSIVIEYFSKEEKNAIIKKILK